MQVLDLLEDYEPDSDVRCGLDITLDNTRLTFHSYHRKLTFSIAASRRSTLFASIDLTG